MNFFNNIINTLINPAYADTTGMASQSGSSGTSLLLMTAVFIFFMYFVIWRPQSKRAKEQRNLISSLAKGDEVVTLSGIVGKIAKINDQYIVLAVTDTIEITMQKNSVANALPKGTLKSIT